MKLTIPVRKNVLERAERLIRFDKQFEPERFEDPIGKLKSLIKAMEAALSELRLGIMIEKMKQTEANGRRQTSTMETLQKRLLHLEDCVQSVRRKKETLIRNGRQTLKQESTRTEDAQENAKTEMPTADTEIQLKKEGKAQWKQ